MLKLRICPQCGTEVKSSSALFCHHCGSELEVKKPPKKSQITKTESAPKIEKKLDFKRILLPLLLVAVLGVGIAAVLLIDGESINIFKASDKSATSVSPLQNQITVKGKTFSIQPFTFGASGLVELVPDSVDFYLESRHPEVLMKEILGFGGGELFKNTVGLDLSEAASYLEDDYVFIEEASASAFIAPIKAKEFVNDKVRSLNEASPSVEFTPYVLENYLVVSNSTDLWERISKASKKLILHLGLSSEFANARRRLPNSGQAFIFGKSRPWLVPESLKGEAFVIYAEGADTVIRGLSSE